MDNYLSKKGARMAEVAVKSFEDVFDVLYEEIKTKEQFTLQWEEELNIQIVLQGDQWDGKIDYKVADFVHSLQDKVLSIYNDLYDVKITRNQLSQNKHLIVKVSISEGSAVLEILLSSFDFLKQGFVNMESKHKAITLVATLGIGILGATGYAIFDSYMEKAKKESDNATQQALFQTFENISKNASAPHMSSLVRKMAPGDIISINGEGYSKKEATVIYKKEPQVDADMQAQTYYIDDKFEIVAAYFETSEIQLKIGDRKIKAVTTALSSTDKTKLYEEYSAADQNNYIPAMDLQVSVDILQGKISSKAMIVGIGNKRAGAVSLKDALQ